MKINIEATVKADLDRTWNAWNTPDDIVNWNTPHESWHTTSSTVDLREGGSFVSRMEAKDGSAGFDFGGTYTQVVPKQIIAYRMGDGREVTTEFIDQGGETLVKTVFDAETENSEEQQRSGWQAILDNFARYVEAKS